MTIRRTTLFLMTCMISVGVFGSLVDMLSRPLSPNDSWYVSAGVLIAEGLKPYTDFPFHQTPYVAGLYGTVFSTLSITSHFLLVSKIINFILHLISLLFIYKLARLIIKDPALTTSIMLLFTSSLQLVINVDHAGNYIMPVTLSILSSYLFVYSLSKTRFFRLYQSMSGIMISMALATKLTYIALIIPFAVVIVIYSHNTSGNLRVRLSGILSALIPFSIGVVIGLLPLIYFVDDVSAFLAGIMSAVSEASSPSSNRLPQLGPRWGSVIVSELLFARRVLFRPDNLALIIGIASGFFVFRRTTDENADGARSIRQGTVLSILLVLVGLAMALAPVPSQPNHFAPPVSLGFVLLVFALARRSEERSSAIRRLVLVLALVALSFSLPRFIEPVPRLFHRDGWGCVASHDGGSAVRKTLFDHGIDTSESIATFSPLIVMEAGFQTYHEFVSGAYGYRRLARETRNQQVLEVLTAKPPAAILVGAMGIAEGRFGDTDSGFVEYARIKGFQPVPFDDRYGQLFIRPGGGSTEQASDK